MTAITAIINLSDGKEIDIDLDYDAAWQDWLPILESFAGDYPNWTSAVITVVRKR